MLTVGYCTRKSDNKFKQHLQKSSGLGKKIEIIEIVNEGNRSLTECYNEIIQRANNDYVVICHSDITIETKSWGVKLIKQHTKNQEFGIIGVAGTKYFADNAKWWEDRTKMYGKVYHTHEGKTWLSSYSEDLGDRIEEVVIVDGVFFMFNKNIIKTRFNEDFKGFHFYDVSFCFENYIQGVKIGVSTVVRINHRSIGMTNDEWEENRKLFVEKYSTQLPVSIKRHITNGIKLRILIGCLSFKELTGSELYVYELAKGLKKEGHDVSICSTIGEPMASMVKRLGIKVYNLSEPPGYKMGDGKWLLKTKDGDVPSQDKVLYKVQNTNYDIIHLNHKPISEYLIKLYPESPMISTIHSEVISLEEPVISEKIKKYIAIRPEIKDFLIDKFGIDENKIAVIYNPIDETRFKPKIKPKTDRKITLFVGTIDYLRKNSIYDLIGSTNPNDDEVWLVGKNKDTYLQEILTNYIHVKHFNPTFSVENYVHKCDETAGVLLGRTTIEGWLCGKPSTIYNIDSYGNIISKELVPPPEDVSKFKSGVVISQIIKEYDQIL